MLNCPPILKILAIFLGMLALTRFRVPLGLAIILGGVGLNAWAGHTPIEVLISLGAALKQSYLWMLLAITALVVEFGRYMSQERNAQAIVALSRRLGGRHGRLWSLIAAPLVIGLVPMPAGALFSAPMVQQVVDEEHWAPEWKTAVNYWFRHVVEYWWPIYPVVIISLTVFHMETWQYVLALIAFTPVTLLAGYLFLLRPHQDRLMCVRSSAPAEPAGRRFVVVILPLMVIIASVLLLPPILSQGFPFLNGQLRKMLAMLIGMLLGLGMILRDDGGWSVRRLFASLAGRHSLNILLTVGSVAIFQSLLDDSRLLPTAGRELMEAGFPVVLLVAGLPLLAGLITGVASGFAGMAFPLIVGLMSQEGAGLTPMATLALAFGFGYMGMMLSPIHLCLLVTRDYFSSSLIPIYRQILPCAAVMLGFSLVLYGVFRAFGW
ncbi:MAG: DUF401 family protein [Verrucomicrobia bacterium]|nr:DUF401 family protein [Verrucomicrobiota bacterium]MBU4248039.1 DUF401 family protein [Verrucomicrobiota bacterium]MBU4291979.1 DUF401 family protein [Verrucomicrobiota bacterium]MBU4497511.1 DUF401 family protein [Verrucomicrobiota bacterium]MCG2681055.1 DUF401 family protein [Kiritimatiellia bacterium]